MPAANRLAVGIMAKVADEERPMTSKRTNDVLAVAKTKARGKRLGGNRGNLPVIGDKGRAISLATRQFKANNRTSELLPVIEELRSAGAVPLRQITAELNAKGIQTAHGGEWSAVQAKRALERV
ncbi:hypothetical protein BB934_28525 (plasmid) [Microvirga ossetica]|uniref:Resolvase n=1 Tax=Microvirga ossetica TaxID=1882682 RepID=A0A1B2EQL4_9HYPH|nr:hypothetical protein [Microvirga ossetica]ANY82274.1 hypothetical protein BB934_28525 [Microvirga ossetica]